MQELTVVCRQSHLTTAAADAAVISAHSRQASKCVHRRSTIQLSASLYIVARSQSVKIDMHDRRISTKRARAIYLYKGR